MISVSEYYRPKLIFIQLVMLMILYNLHCYILVPNLRLIVEYFKTTYAYAGILLGAYIILSGFASLLWALYSDIKGVKRKALITLGIFACGIFTFFAYIIENMYLFALFYIIAGMFIAVVNPFSITIIIDTFRSHERTEKLMLLSVLGGIGLGLGFLISLITMAYYDSWKLSLLITSLINLLFGVPLAILLLEPPKGLSEEELYDILVQTKSYPFALRREDLQLIIGNTTNKYVVLQGIFGTLANGALQVWLLQYLVIEVGMSETAASIFLGLSSAAAIGGILIAKLADVLYKRSPKLRPLIAAICSFLEGIFFIIFLILPIRAEITTFDFAEAMVDLFSLMSSSPMLILSAISFSIAMLFNSSVGSIRDSVLSDVNLPEHRATVISGTDIIELFMKSISSAAIGTIIYITGSIRYPLVAFMVFWFLSGYYWISTAQCISQDIQRIKSILQERRDKILKWIKT